MVCGLVCGLFTLVFLNHRWVRKCTDECMIIEGTYDQKVEEKIKDRQSQWNATH